MPTIAVLFLLASLHAPAPTMEEVPPYENRRIAALAMRNGTVDVLVARKAPNLEVGLWSPRSAKRL